MENKDLGAWIMTPIPMTVRGAGGPAKIIVGGWARGFFAIDERENRTWMGGKPKRGKVWCITHLPTGYAARFVLGSRKFAQQMADKIADAADWSFSNPTEAKSRGPAVKAIMDRNPGAFVDAFEAGPPTAINASPNGDAPNA